MNTRQPIVRKKILFLGLLSFLVVLGCALTSSAQKSGLDASSDVEISEAGTSQGEPVQTGEPQGLSPKKTAVLSVKKTAPADSGAEETPMAGPDSSANNEKVTATPAQAVPTAQTASQPQSSVDRNIIGVEVNLGSPQVGIEMVKQAGASWVRTNGLEWSAVEPEEGDRDWSAVSSLEDDLRLTSSLGMHTILIIRGTPTWAQMIDGYYCGPIKTEKLTAFTQFVHDAVARYSVDPYNVKYWEIWNEPDVPDTVEENSPYGCFGDSSAEFYGAGEYSQMLKAVYPEIKAVDKDAKVLVGGLLMDCDPVNPPETSAGSGQPKDCSSSTFLEGILADGAGNSFDGVSFHAYDYYQGTLGQYGNGNWWSDWNSTGPVMIAKVQYLKNLLQQYNVPNKSLFNTEMALICGTTGNEDVCQTDDFNLTKAYYAAQAYGATLAGGLDASMWYSFAGWRASGLVNSNLETRKVYDAVKVAAQKMSGAKYVGPVSQFTGVMGYEFTLGGQRTWLVWSMDGVEHQINLDSMPTTITSVFGESLTAVQNVTVDLAPIYIEWSQ